MLSYARDRSQPCVRLTQIGLKARGLDVIDAPTVAKDRPDLGLSYASRSPIARLLVAEAHQKVGATQPKNSPEAISEVGAIFVREHMKQPRINDGVEWLLGHGEVERVGELETSLETTPFCFGPRLPDRGRRAVDPRCNEAMLGQVEDVFAGPAPDVQDQPSDLAGLGQPHDRGLRAADIPWRGSEVSGFKYVCRHGWKFPSNLDRLSPEVGQLGARSPDGSAQLVDADEVARRIAEGAVADAVRLLDRLLDDFGAAGLDPREDAVEVGSGQDDGSIAALGHHLDDGAALVVGDGAGADAWRVKDDRRAGLVGRADRDPAHPTVSDIIADLEAEGVAIERERCVRVGVWEEARVNAEVRGSHARTGSVTRASRILIGLVTCFATHGAIPSVARAS